MLADREVQPASALHHVISLASTRDFAVTSLGSTAVARRLLRWAAERASLRSVLGRQPLRPWPSLELDGHPS